MQLIPFPLSSAAMICTNVQNPDASFSARDMRIPIDKRYLVLIYSGDELPIRLLDASDPCKPRHIFKGKKIADALREILALCKA